ncbi:Hypothetical protein R9X50_00136000 [Acrodontium crateriforme]|uniref:HECT-type E3 ubiquitin transferase n=1 Tax=Acrodontium crateriforme TaxID=150365 RepID=A0AAQ3LZC6_9PEZI|nr:Hypothetical protein R9X50_00136000 [Acrodontium crateriforme]
MSQRVTRASAARLTADSSVTDFSPTTATDTASPPCLLPPASRKRKATREASPPVSRDSRKAKKVKSSTQELDSTPPPEENLKRAKRGVPTDMSSAGYYQVHSDIKNLANETRQSSGTSGETSPQQAPRDSSKRKGSRRKSKEDSLASGRKAAAGPGDGGSDLIGSASGSGSRRSKRGSKKDQDVLMKDVDEKAEQDNEDPEEEEAKREADGGAEDDNELDSMERDDDPFASAYLSRFAGHSGLSSSLRALSGIMSGTTGRLRGILEQMRVKEDPSTQLIALQELSELLLVSNEDNLAGHFAPDQYVKELVSLMQPNEFTGEENPEIMLLACRCIANLMEALPAATASVVYGGAVPILCQKLLEIHFIDLAEQALSTLEKISVEFPSSIVREGGLTACLTYLDFFATSTQRTAVTTAANCCRNIPEDSFPTVRDVMPILLTTLSSNDQRVVEQASLCVSRVIDSFKFHESRLEELVSPELLQAVQRLLLPGSTNMIGPNIHTQFLRVLSITARASPRLSVEMLKMNVVDTLYQILTGVSPPSDTNDAASKIDKNIIMQAIIRTPREQIFETLNIICELLPNVSDNDLMFLDELTDAGYTGESPISLSSRSKKTGNDKKVELLKGCRAEVKRFAVILFPTLMYAYTSTVNLSVRQKVLTAQLKMLSNLETDILEEVLRDVSFASHLASILSQQENPSLVTFALQAAELLLKRLEDIYRPQFYREGVMAEISRLAERKLTAEKILDIPDKIDGAPDVQAQSNDEDPAPPPHDDNVDDQDTIDIEGRDENDDGDDQDYDEDNETHRDEDDDEDDDDDGDVNDISDDSDSVSARPTHRITDLQDIITIRANRFMEAHGHEGSPEMRAKAKRVLEDLHGLTAELKNCYTSSKSENGDVLFRRLANYFEGNALESITSYELMTSGIVDSLVGIFNNSDEQMATDARSDFLEVFMATNNSDVSPGHTSLPLTPFSALVHKLQDLLSRAEHFEVITVNHNAFESNRSSAASMLAKQLRLQLAADEDSGIPRQFRNIMVSIHAIATFKALDDYLRPRISLHEIPRAARRDGITNAMAAYAAAMAGRGGFLPPALPGSSSQTGKTAPSSSSKKKSTKSEADTQAEIRAAEETSPQPRRSSRRHSGQGSSTQDPPALRNEATERPEDSQEAPECPDETRFDDEQDNDLEADLDALVDDLEDGALDDEAPDPSAVNLEVANTGKVTARTEDGLRVATPSQGAPTPTKAERTASAVARPALTREPLSTPTSSGSAPSGRGMSYASALQQTPKDWHLEFSVNGQPISSETTIYRACHFNQVQGDEAPSRGIWSATHTIKFRRVPGPPQAPSPTSQDKLSSQNTVLPPSLDKHPVTANILRLMSILHDLNANLDDVLAEHKSPVKVNAEPLSQFVNTKITAKLNRQLEEPLIVASLCLPSWAEDLARLYPFLFPFETRRLFLQSTSFGYARSMSRWQSSPSENDSRHHHRDERPFLGRIQRQKVRISRSRILESAIKVMELYGGSQSMLEVEYFEEVGTGLGPTLEFYSTVSKELSKKKTKLWRENESFEGDEFAFGRRGLFPAPMSEAMSKNENGQRVLHLFKVLGKFVARSMMDSRIIDISFNPTFFRIGEGTSIVTPSLGAVATVDQDLAKSLKMLKKYANAKQRIEEDNKLSTQEKACKIDEIRINDARIDDLGLDFTLPGYPHIELQALGSTINVTIDNVSDYIKAVIDYTLGSGVQRQLDAFQAGFSQVFPYSALKAFTSEELVMLFGRVEEDWSLETLMDSIKADHGYNLDSKSVRNLLQTMSELSAHQRRDFLQFVTGSPKLPIGGFKALTPMFTVVCKPSEPPLTSDDYLPSVMTCVNYLKMPDYSSLDVLKQKLNVAIQEGQGAFHLS